MNRPGLTGKRDALKFLNAESGFLQLTSRQFGWLYEDENDLSRILYSSHDQFSMGLICTSRRSNLAQEFVSGKSGIFL